ncbi:MAG: oxidoreductase [Eggerthellaceae bacterium]|nr:oxidoreductase [Eggerthellaceae bacterium]
MSSYGLLIDTKYCTGCHSCEMACQVEHDYPIGQSGIIVNEIGPWQINDRKWQLSYVPVLSDQCDLCAERVQKGKTPTCVKHCQAGVMSYGTIGDLVEKMADKPSQILMTPSKW